MANDCYTLWKLGITHVVNVAHGTMHCQGSHHFYGSMVDYYGVPADDSPAFDLSPYFFPSAEYIKNALDNGGKCFNVTQAGLFAVKSKNQAHVILIFPSPPARVFVHCAVGVSRSASIVLAFLMIHHHFTLLEAINKVKERRWIFPNRGFLEQLCALDMKLHRAS